MKKCLFEFERGYVISQYKGRARKKGGAGIRVYMRMEPGGAPSLFVGMTMELYYEKGRRASCLGTDGHPFGGVEYLGALLVHPAKMLQALKVAPIRRAYLLGMDEYQARGMS